MTIQLVAGLLLGVGWMHEVRARVLDDLPARRFIARAGAVLYLTAGVLCLLPFLWANIVGLIIAVLGPVAGFTAVLLTDKPDDYQIQVGWFQALTLVAAVVAVARILEVYR